MLKKTLITEAFMNISALPKESLARLKEEIVCGICLDVLKTPLALRCNHSFCSDCLQEMIDNLNIPCIENSSEIQIYCPSCRSNETILQKREPLKATNIFPLNHGLRNIIEIIKTSDELRLLVLGGQKEEEENNELCFQTTHTQLRACGLHPANVVKSFCAKCVLPVCRACIAIKHSGHKIEVDKMAVVLAEKELRSSVDRAAVYLEALNEGVENIDRAKNKILRSEQEIILEIHQIFKKCVGVVKSVEKSRVQELRKIVDHKIRKLNLQRNLLIAESGKMSGVKKFTENVLQKSLAIENYPVFQINKELMQNCYELPLDPEEEDSFVFNIPCDSEEMLRKAFGKLTVHSTDAALCHAVGDGLRHAKSGFPASFTVHIKDRKGTATVELKDIRAVITGHGEESELNASYHVIEPGKIQVSYIPICVGEHAVNVYIRGHHIHGSPFVVQVHAMREIDEICKTKLCFGEYGTRNREFQSPLGVTSDLDELIYVVDSFNRRVQIFTSNGEDMSILDQSNLPNNSPNFLAQPWGIACFGQDRMLAISDYARNQLKIFSTLNPEDEEDEAIPSLMTCNLTLGSTNHSHYNFYHPCGVSFGEKSKMLLLCDTGNTRIQCFDTEGQFQFSIQAKSEKFAFSPPKYATFDQNNQLVYVSDGKRDRILTFDIRSSHQEFESKFEVCPASKEKLFLRPSGLHVDDVGNILVADSGNGCIRIISRDGVHLRTLNGGCGGGGGVDVGKKNAFCPECVTVTKYGVVVVTDAKNHKVRIF